MNDLDLISQIKCGNKFIVNPNCYGVTNQEYPSTWVREMNEFAGKILTIDSCWGDKNIPQNIRITSKEIGTLWKFDICMIYGLIDCTNGMIIHNERYCMDNDGDIYEHLTF